MERILKPVAVIVLLISSLTFGITMFTNNLIKVDVVDTIVESDTVKNEVTNSLDSLREASGITDDTLWQKLKDTVKNDPTFNDLTKQYVETILDELLNNNSTFDPDSIRQQLLSYSDVMYELTNPGISKEEFNAKLETMVDNVDLNQVHQQIITKVEQNVPSSTIKPMQTVYHYTTDLYIYISLALMIISTGYLGFTSYQNKKITKGLSGTYLASGILMFVGAVVIVMVLSAMASSTMSFKITSIRYMYIIGGAYLAIAIILTIVNKVLASKTSKYYY